MPTLTNFYEFMGLEDFYEFINDEFLVVKKEKRCGKGLLCIQWAGKFFKCSPANKERKIR